MKQFKRKFNSTFNTTRAWTHAYAPKNILKDKTRQPSTGGGVFQLGGPVEFESGGPKLI